MKYLIIIKKTFGKLINDANVNSVISDHLPQIDDGNFSGTSDKWGQKDPSKKITGRNEMLYIKKNLINWDNDLKQVAKEHY